jgi:tetratricopeptide (TPR) repeat protein
MHDAAPARSPGPASRPDPERRPSPTARTLPRGALLLAAALLACATARRPPPGAAELRFAPEEPRVAAVYRELAGLDDAGLHAAGDAAYEAGDHARAAAAYARLADAFPASPHAPAALLRAGLSYQRLEAWRLALERFRARARLDEGADALEASFGAAECLYRLGEVDEARAALEALAARPGLATAPRVRALAQLGVLELEQGRAAEAEATLRRAVSEWEAGAAAGPLPPYYAAQARFHLGELRRGAMRALPLDPSAGDPARLELELERKAGALLEAQEHYLAAIRTGEPRWAVVAGGRVGELYEDLRRELLDAPLPPGLDAAAAETYRDELRGQVGVLASKAVTAYRQTIDFARRAGVEDPGFLADAQAGLERLERAAASAPEGAGPATPGSAPGG